jgi:hypothetical protein
MSPGRIGSAGSRSGIPDLELGPPIGAPGSRAGGSPTKADFARIPRYENVARTSPGEMTGAILIEKAPDLVNRSPAPDQ